MPKRKWTEEERKAFGAKMKAARAKKEQANRASSSNLPEEKVSKPEPAPDTISQEDYLDLVKQIQELKDIQWQGRVQDSRVALQGGKLIGTVEKYDLTPEVYPNPIERLSKEARLARFAFKENYVLDFDVAVSEYTTIDQIRTKEPKFTLVLAAYMFDEDSGEQVFNDDGSPQAYVVRRLIMHEDPEAALAIAREQNLEVDEENETAFLNEMRYIRMRDFLLECFFPTKPKDVNRKTEVVVGGTVVETFQVTSNEPVKINFDKLNKSRI